MSETFPVTCGSETVEIEKLAWDSGILGIASARIKDVTGTSTASNFKNLPAELKAHGLEYVTARLPQSDWKRIFALQAAGFVLVDGILNFRREIKALPVPAGEFRLAGPGDADPVGALAAETFIYSRFHNDPLIKPEAAKRVHYEWGRNSCLGTAADAVWLVHSGGTLAGFCTAKISDGLGTIVLLAVDKKFAGKGFGRKLTEKTCAWLFEKGIKTVEVQTQTSNLPALSLYSACGFAPHSASFTLRWSSR